MVLSGASDLQTRIPFLQNHVASLAPIPHPAKPQVPGTQQHHTTTVSPAGLPNLPTHPRDLSSAWEELTSRTVTPKAEQELQKEGSAVQREPPIKTEICTQTFQEDFG